ncbi:hypothetical protein [Paenibacillus medicaginis]|uniref:Uncharacterized protein n=1 Tax=Paenibacillus medicaginis TaxID=1470560 RepID=A0ABV5C8W5_9BACL
MYQAICGVGMGGTLNEAEEQVIQEFKHKAQMNLFALEIEMGQEDLLEEYVSFLHKHPDECVKGLTTIMEAAVRYGWRIDRILHTFSEQAVGFAIESGSSNNDEIYHYFYQRAMYEQWMGRPRDAVECILQALRLAHKLGRVFQEVCCTVGIVAGSRDEGANRAVSSTFEE